MTYVKLMRSVLIILLTFFVSTSWASTPESITLFQEQLLKDSWASFTKAVHSKKLIPYQDLKWDLENQPQVSLSIGRNELLNTYTVHLLNMYSWAINDPTKLKSEIENMFTSYSHNIPYARLAFLRPVTNINYQKVTNFRLFEIKTPSVYPDNHTIKDLNAYVSERIPKSLQEFIHLKKVKLFLDENRCDVSYSLQYQLGFKQIFQFMGPRDSDESQFAIVYNQEKNAYRLLICSLYGRDEQVRAMAILGPIIEDHKALFAQYKYKMPFISVKKTEWEKLKVNALNDRVVVGFQNSVWWEIYTQDKRWVRKSLVESGIELSEFSNSETGERLFSLENTFGDNTLAALEILYNKGFRKFVYLGSAGGLDTKFQIGDVLLPNLFKYKNNRTISVKNSASDLQLKLPVDNNNTIHFEGYQGWVPNLIVESEDYVKAILNSGIQSIDIESAYFAKFFKSHRVYENGIVLIISDLPLGEVTYENEQLTRIIVMKNVKSIVNQLLKDKRK